MPYKAEYKSKVQYQHHYQIQLIQILPPFPNTNIIPQKHYYHQPQSYTQSESHTQSPSLNNTRYKLDGTKAEDLNIAIQFRTFVRTTIQSNGHANIEDSNNPSTPNELTTSQSLPQQPIYNNNNNNNMIPNNNNANHNHNHNTTPVTHTIYNANNHIYYHGHPHTQSPTSYHTQQLPSHSYGNVTTYGSNSVPNSNVHNSTCNPKKIPALNPSEYPSSNLPQTQTHIPSENPTFNPTIYMAPVLFSPTTFILSRPPPVEYDLYESIISGNIGNVNTNEDNCYHVLKYNTIITLNRVVIEDGNANYEYGGPETRDNLNGFGGGLITNDILAQQQYITISDSKFRNNEALGGGALWFGSSNRCNGCNMEGGYGGAIYAYDHVTMIITQTLFENNFAQFRGAALYQGFGGQFQCNQCQFISNKVAAYGGAIFNEDQTSPNIDSNNIGYMMLNEVFGQILGSTIEQNQTGYTGGGEALMWSIMQETGANTFSNNIPNDQFQESPETIYSEVDSTVYISTVALENYMWSLWSNYIRNTGEIDIGLDLGPDRCYVNNLNPSFIVHDGLTWTGAYTTIQECLDQLINTGGEVWVVGNGENNPYYPTAYRVLGTNNDAEKTFRLHSFIRMYGGFTGNEVQKWERDFYNYPTYLSGDINGVTANNLIMPGDFTLIDGFYIGYAGCDDANEVQMGGIYADYKRFM